MGQSALEGWLGEGEELTVDAVERLQRQADEGDGGWVFRGLANDAWELTSTLDRMWERAASNKNRGAGFASSKANLEERLLQTFKRVGHLYLSRPPSEDDGLAWRAFMQHYGAPTRLVDFTYSIWVAIFFAVQPGAAESDTAAVWAVRSHALRKKAFAMLGKKAPAATKRYRKDLHLHDDPTLFRQIYGKKHDFVLPQNTYRQHERIVAQQALFLCPGNVDKAFHDNLHAMVGRSRSRQNLIRRFTIPRSKLAAWRRRLYRMNITSATLYPGLSGFAASLQHRALVRDGLAWA